MPLASDEGLFRYLVESEIVATDQRAVGGAHHQQKVDAHLLELDLGPGDARARHAEMGLAGLHERHDLGGVVDAQRQGHLRVHVQERAEQARQDVLPRRRRDRKVEMPADAVGEPPDLVARGLELPENATRMREQGPACLGQLDLAVPALQERGSEIRFQRLYLHRDGGL